MTRVLLGIAALGVIGMLAAELLLQPSSMDRLGLAGLLGGVTAATMLLAAALQRVQRRSIAAGVLATSLVAVVVAGLAVTASGVMFVSPHDLRLSLVAIGLGVGSGLALSIGLVQPLLGDLNRIGITARAVAEGERDVRTGVMREDELGATAAALDDLVDRLGKAEADRERLERARSNFLAAIGHDLRSPLTVLQAGLEGISDGMVDDTDALIHTLRREVRLMGSLVEDLFMLARIESDGLQLQTERLDLAELADEAAEAIAPVAARRSVGVVVTAPDEVPVDGDPRELGRVLRNLLDNAVRHTPTGSTITVTVDQAGAAIGEEVRLIVLDEGDGFSAASVEEVFSSFVRGDEARVRDGSGAGLGLAIARGLVAAHGGTITARSGPGGRVEVHLPKATA